MYYNCRTDTTFQVFLYMILIEVIGVLLSPTDLNTDLLLWITYGTIYQRNV